MINRGGCLRVTSSNFKFQLLGDPRYKRRYITFYFGVLDQCILAVFDRTETKPPLETNVRCRMSSGTVQRKLIRDRPVIGAGQPH